jgi:hypothetical protein
MKISSFYFTALLAASFNVNSLLAHQYELYPDGTAACPVGLEVTIEECAKAGDALGGILRDGSNLVMDDWSHTPCGCFIASAYDGAIHFDLGKAGCYGSSEYIFEVVCHKNTREDMLAQIANLAADLADASSTLCSLSAQNGNECSSLSNQFDYEKPQYELYPDGTAACPVGLEVSIEECAKAGDALGGILRDGSNLVMDYWDHTPCGCFIASAYDGAIHFDLGKGGCYGGSEYVFEVVCHKSTREDLLIQIVSLSDKLADIQSKVYALSAQLGNKCFLSNQELKTAVANYYSGVATTKSSVVNMYGEIADWQVWDVTDFSNLFYPYGYPSGSARSELLSFNVDLSKWNTRKAVSMYRMFFQAFAFNNGGQALTWDGAYFLTCLLC